MTKGAGIIPLDPSMNGKIGELIEYPGDAIPIMKKTERKSFVTTVYPVPICIRLVHTLQNINKDFQRQTDLGVLTMTRMNDSHGRLVWGTVGIP
jgi:hypothetical protein